MRFLFIDIDTLRPDHMGCYGYERNTTPNIDNIAKDGVMFNNYYTSDAPCLPARASLISGMYGFNHGAVGHGGTASDRRNPGERRGFKNDIDEGNFHNIFRKAGMYTTSISTFAERHSLWWFNAGLNEMHNVGKCGDERGDEVLPVALDWLERKGADDDWYLHIHLWDPHTPYRVPEHYGHPFKDEPMPSWITEEILEEHKKHTGPHSINEISMYDDFVPEKFKLRQPGKCENMEELKHLFDSYDTGIHYADYTLGKVFDKLKELGVYEDTIICITSDHGENFGELGLYAEHGTADNITCKIPMIVKWPNMEKNIINNNLHYNIDLLPTVAELLNVNPSNHWDGQSYANALKGEEQKNVRDSLVLSQNAHVCQRSARFDDWLYMRTYHDGYHLFDKEMLFNVKNDPYEQFDVKEENPEICQKGAKIILDWVDEQMLKDPTNTDPMWTVMREGGPFHTRTDLKRYIERLENTGREEGAKILRERYNIK